MSATDDKSSLYDSLSEFFGRKAEEVDGDDTDEETESAGQKGDSPDADADQKQETDPDEETVTEDLITALAEDLDVPVDDLQKAIESVGHDADDEPDPEDDADEEDDEADRMPGEAKSQDGSPEVSIDFGAKAEEHGLVDEETLGEKMDSLREDIVEDLGQKLAEENEEAVEEIAQKMAAGQTPDPAGGSFQDAQDFDSHLDDIAEEEGW